MFHATFVLPGLTDDQKSKIIEKMKVKCETDGIKLIEEAQGMLSCLVAKLRSQAVTSPLFQKLHRKWMQTSSAASRLSGAAKRHSVFPVPTSNMWSTSSRLTLVLASCINTQFCHRISLKGSNLLQSFCGSRANGLHFGKP